VSTRGSNRVETVETRCCRPVSQGTPRRLANRPDAPDAVRWKRDRSETRRRRADSTPPSCTPPRYGAIVTAATAAAVCRRAMSPPRCLHAPCHGAPAARKRERDTAQGEAGRRRSFSRCTVKHDLTSKSKTKEIRRRVEGRSGAPRHRTRLARGTWRAPWPHRRRCQRAQLHLRHETAVVGWGWPVIAGWLVVRCPPCTHRCTPNARPSGVLGGL
jgi:hypothetical protein